MTRPKNRKATRWRPTYSAIDLLLASPTKPMPPERRRHQLTRMHMALDGIAKSDKPTDDDWRLVCDAINLMESIVMLGVAKDESGLLHDAVAAVATACDRAERTGQAMRLDGPGLAAIRAVLEDWEACLDHLPERTIIAAHAKTERRVRAILQGKKRMGHDVVRT